MSAVDKLKADAEETRSAMDKIMADAARDKAEWQRYRRWLDGQGDDVKSLGQIAQFNLYELMKERGLA